MKFRLLVGRHQGPGVRNHPDNYEKDDVVESSEPLHILFPNKFKKVKDDTPASVTNPGTDTEKKMKVAKPTTEEEEGETQEEVLEDGALGENVTDDFPGVKEAGLLVFKKGKKYNVAEEAFPTVAINESPLTKTEVHKLVDDSTSNG